MNTYQVPYVQQAQTQEIIPYGQAQYQQPYGQVPAYLVDTDCEKIDNPKIGLVILSFIFPIVGWILWATNKDEKPAAARTYSLCAWAAFGLNTLIRLISFAL